ncbi:MAG TPA: response regulator [Gemmatimonadales bacterium]|nr:response regulator [Gemmatimonadales bacterium]
MTHPTGLSRAWIERLVESNILGITVEQDGTIVEANDAFLGTLGYTRDDLVAGRLRSRDLTPPEYADLDARALDDMLRHGGYAPLEKELLRKDGSRVAVLVGAAALSRAPLTSVAFVLDLTERKALEARGRRAQRMESIIRLAGGIAHDFNNQLTAILGSAELLLENRTLDPEGRADVEQIRKAANRAAQLARQLLAFSRRQASQPRVLDLNAVLDEIRLILRHLVGERIEVATDLDPAGAPALADLAQLEQTIVDAALHARDRMPDGGRLTLATRSVRVTGADGPPGLPPGRYTALTVRDSGPPLGAVAADPLFEPRQSGAYAEVRNEPDGGAALTLYLPAVEPTTREGAPPPAPEAPAGETILLVEDEEQVRRLARRVLERAGFVVVEAGDAEAALRRANRHPGTIHLLVVDMMLPGLSGRELAAQLAIHRPAVKVLYISGTADDAIGRHQVLAPGTEFLQKPFALDQLVRKVRKVLDSPSRP